MTDKKLTDEEIIKRLERCVKQSQSKTLIKDLKRQSN